MRSSKTGIFLVFLLLVSLMMPVVGLSQEAKTKPSPSPSPSQTPPEQVSSETVKKGNTTITTTVTTKTERTGDVLVATTITEEVTISKVAPAEPAKVVPKKSVRKRVVAKRSAKRHSKKAYVAKSKRKPVRRVNRTGTVQVVRYRDRPDPRVPALQKEVSDLKESNADLAKRNKDLSDALATKTAEAKANADLAVALQKDVDALKASSQSTAGWFAALPGLPDLWPPTTLGSWIIDILIALLIVFAILMLIPNTRDRFIEADDPENPRRWYRRVRIRRRNVDGTEQVQEEVREEAETPAPGPATT
jgi:hypothetical protein